MATTIIARRAASRATNSVADSGDVTVTAVALASDTTVADINRLHRLARQHANSACQAAAECGALLTKKKQQLPHGELIKWIEMNCEFSPRSARAYMQVAAMAQNGSALPLSSIRQALLPEEPKAKAKCAPATDIDVDDADDAAGRGTPDVIVTFKAEGNRARHRSAGKIIKGFIDDVHVATERHAESRRQFPVVAGLPGFTPAEARQYADFLKDSIGLLTKMRKGLLEIAARDPQS